MELLRVDWAAIRKAPATRVLVIVRFFFLTGLPPLVGWSGANLKYRMNLFSWAKLLRSTPCSLIRGQRCLYSKAVNSGQVASADSVQSLPQQLLPV